MGFISTNKKKSQKTNNLFDLLLICVELLSFCCSLYTGKRKRLTYSLLLLPACISRATRKERNNIYIKKRKEIERSQEEEIHNRHKLKSCWTEEKKEENKEIRQSERENFFLSITIWILNGHRFRFVDVIRWLVLFLSFVIVSAVSFWTVLFFYESSIKSHTQRVIFINIRELESDQTTPVQIVCMTVNSAGTHISLTRLIDCFWAIMIVMKWKSTSTFSELPLNILQIIKTHRQNTSVNESVETIFIKQQTAAVTIIIIIINSELKSCSPTFNFVLVEKRKERHRLYLVAYNFVWYLERKNTVSKPNIDCNRSMQMTLFN